MYLRLALELMFKDDFLTTSVLRPQECATKLGLAVLHVLPQVPCLLGKHSNTWANAAAQKLTTALICIYAHVHAQRPEAIRPPVLSWNSLRQVSQ